jgi:hypothetical protein
MPYNRPYSQHEVHEILWDSECRTRPTASAGHGQRGHAITQHGDGRANVLDKRYWTITLKHQTLEEGRKYGPIPPVVMPPSTPVGSDSRFLSRLDLIRAVTHALNSPSGQIELSKLFTQPTVMIDVPLDRSLGIRAEQAGHAVAKIGTGKAKKTVEAHGPSSYTRGVALGVFLLVDRVKTNDPACAIHIHTAYPTAVG